MSSKEPEMFINELTKILLKSAFSFGGKGLLGGILSAENQVSCVYFANKSLVILLKTSWLQTKEVDD